MRKILCVMLMLSVNFSKAQIQQHRYLRSGDKDYSVQQYTDAEENYRKANALKPSFRGNYNLGNAIYSQERFEEAVKQFEESLQRSKSSEETAKAYHNLGNAYYNQQAYDKSVDAYKNALRYQPADWDTKRNLIMALNRLEQQQQQQNQQQQDQQQQQNQQQDPQQGQSSDITNSEYESQDNSMDKHDAEQLLDIVEREDQRVQEKIKKSADQKKKPEKDW